ncbi:beta strand repeat-containing protein, partial [Limnohabitans sp.]|uniref:beta strand repeat-containing protein n=1 Tax=Limnohabitans sp. TaxID=1907725 RepID=UPI0038B92F51
ACVGCQRFWHQRLGSVQCRSGGSAALASLNVSAANISLNASSVNTSGNQTYTGAITLNRDVSLLATGTHAVVTANGTLNSDGTARALTLNASGTNGSGVFNAAVGNTAALASVNVTAANIALNASSVNTSGNQTYTGAVTLNRDVSLLATGTNAVVTADGMLNSDGTARALTLNASGSNGAGVFNAALGNTAALASLNVSAANISLNAISVNTTGNQTYTGAVTLNRDVSLLATGTNAVVTANGTLNSDGTARTLTLNASGSNGSGVFNAAVGNTSALASLNVTATNIALNASSVNTSGNQTYAGTVTLNRDVNLLATGTHAVVTAHGTLNSDGTARALTLNASGTNSSAVFEASVGNTAALASLNVTATNIALNASSVNTTGNQTYTGAVTLNRDVSLLATGSNAVITANGLVNSDGTARSFTLNASGNQGRVLFASALGGSQDLSALNVSASSITIGGGAITTLGNQSYNGAVTLGADTQLTSTGAQGVLNLNGTVNSDSTARSLTVNAGAGNSTLEITDSVGATQALSRFTNAAATTVIGNASTLSPVSIATLNDLQFTGAVQLQAPTHVVLASAGTLAGQVTGSAGLYKEGAGTLLLTQANSFTGAIQVNAGTLSTSNAQGLGADSAAIRLASGTVLDLQGVAVGTKALTLQGATLRASNGTSSWAGPIALTADSRIDVTGQQFTATGVVDGSQSGLALSGTGAVVMRNADNTLSRLASANSTASIDLKNSTALSIGNVTPQGVTYAGLQSAGAITLASTAPVTVMANSSLASTGGDIVLQTSRFINQAGATALSTTAPHTWQVWSTNATPFDALSGDSANTLNNDYVYYNANRGSLQSVPAGHGLLYSYTPVAVVSLTGSVVKNYDGTNQAQLSPANFRLSGEVVQRTGEHDVLTFNNPPYGLYVSAGTGAAVKDAGAQKDVEVTGLALTAQQSGKPVFGYTFASTITGRVGEIQPKPLDLAFTKVYEGNNRFDNTNTYVLSGMVGSEASPLINAGQATVTSPNAGTYNQFTSSLTIDNPNYTLTGGAQLATINKAPLGIAIKTLFKAKTDLPDIAARDFNVVGLQNGESIPKIDLLTLAYKDVSLNDTNYVKSITVSPGNGVANMANYAITQTVNAVPKATDGGNTMNMVKLMSPDEVITFPAAPPPSLPVVSAPAAAPAVPSGAAPAPAPAPVAAPVAAAATTNLTIPGIRINTITAPTPQSSGLVTVMLPQGSTNVATVGLVIPLPQLITAPISNTGGEPPPLSVTLTNNQPLPAWIRYDETQKALVTSPDSRATFPITVVITVGEQRTVVVVSESLQN